jgi:hypothetical protein
VEPGTQRVLRFNYANINIGNSSLTLGNPQDNPDRFDCSSCREPPCVLRRFAEYRLWPSRDGYASWTQVRESNPASTSTELLQANTPLAQNMMTGELNAFCVSDVLSCTDGAAFLQCPTTPSAPSSFPVENGTQCNNQGISVGWADFYDTRMDTQLVMVQPSGGTMILEAEVNPDREFSESDYMNNFAAVCLNIPPSDPAARQMYAPDPECVTPIELTGATPCQLCEALCLGFGFCSATEAAPCSASNCFCGSECNYPPPPAGIAAPVPPGTPTDLPIPSLGP